MRIDHQLETSATQNGAVLEARLTQLQAEIADLKKVHAQEMLRRAQVENELQEARQRLQLVMDTLPEAIFWKDRNSTFLGCNRNFAEDAGLNTPDNIIGQTDYDMPWEKKEADFYRACDRRVMLADHAEIGIVEPQLQADGKQAWLETNKVPLHNGEGKVIGILGTYQDITERKQAEIALQEMNQKLERQTVELTAAVQQLQQSQVQLVQQEKMSALGNLIAGIAHEMNNPVGFLSGNLRPAQDYVTDLIGLIELYRKALPNPGEAIAAEIEDIDLDYICADLPKLLHSMGEGIKRIRDISTSLRTFSRSDQEHKITFALQAGLDSTLLILRHRLKANEYRPAIEIVKHYDEQMPSIFCFPGQLNQVFMNLLANAVDALDEASKDKTFELLKAQPNQITVSTQLSDGGEMAIVKIKDNGTGMTAATQQKAFENLFTTKAVGQGTGLGLAIAYQIIVEKHGGTIDIDSTLGQGTEFTLKIPVK
ncbi:MAG: ATP-binding protein [Cyanobacteria bacterium P01_D01_bin.105]